MPSWLRVLDAVLSLTDLAIGKARTRASGQERMDELSTTSRAAAGPLEARLAGVVVAALKEAFDRDHQRLQLEREQIDAERHRAERALRLELIRQAGDREIGRLRLLAGTAVVSWLGTLFFTTRLIEGHPAARGALAVGWLLLLGALAAAFAGQSRVADVLARTGEGSTVASPSAGAVGQLAPWLIVLGLAVIAAGVLFA